MLATPGRNHDQQADNEAGHRARPDRPAEANERRRDHQAALPLTNLKGATPKQVFYSVLYAENRKADGLVTKVGPGGTFRLNPKRRKAKAGRS
jgi:hypothetical protein